MFEGLDFKGGLILSVFGIVFIVIGAINDKYTTVRLAGTLISAVGMIVMGIRLYERIKKKVK